MYILLIQLDGLGDRPVSKGKTPLQLAKTKNFDKLAKEGINGISYPLGPGLVPGSDTGHLAIFGYNPRLFYCGRGILEALGSRIPIYEKDVGLRCNFATIDAKRNVTDRRAGRIDDKGAKTLAKAISDIKIKGKNGGSYSFAFHHTHEHRGVLIIRGRGVSTMISDTDSHLVGPAMWSGPLNDTEEAKKTADALNEWKKKVNSILNEHPLNKERTKKNLPVANFVITRGASMLFAGKPQKGAEYTGIFNQNVSITTFKEKYGLDGVCVAGGSLYKGVARYVGIDAVDIEGVTTFFDTDLNAKVTAALTAIKRGKEYVFLHFKAADRASHDGDWKAKVKFIEKVDKAIAPFLKLKDTIIVVTADHSTPCALKAHSADPVPILIWGPAGTVRTDDVKKFDEISAARGGLGRITHTEVMPTLLTLLGKAKMFGT